MHDIKFSRKNQIVSACTSTRKKSQDTIMLENIIKEDQNLKKWTRLK